MRTTIVSVDEHGLGHVLGGLGSDSMASVDVEPSAEHTPPGDEALAEAVRRELKEDATATRVWTFDVFVRCGILHLRGRLLAAEDVDNADAEAAKVPGVREVVDHREMPRR